MHFMVNRRLEHLQKVHRAAVDLVKQFDSLKEHQYKLLVEGQTLESAAENWEAATSVSIDFEPLIKAVKGH